MSKTPQDQPPFLVRKGGSIAVILSGLAAITSAYLLPEDLRMSEGNLGGAIIGIWSIAFGIYIWIWWDPTKRSEE